ncbi:MAG: amidase family protein [Oscillospiraceae bacterium]|nr:amidase family protein [Oscillospiraceae bacterium]
MNHFITRFDIESSLDSERAVLEDSIMLKGHPATVGSKMLENFISPLDATVVERLEANGVTVLGKTKMDEFGARGLFPSIKYPAPGSCEEQDLVAEVAENAHSLSADEQKNGHPDLVYHSGAVACVAEGAAEFGLCNDYTGATSHEAALSGVCYIRPTYGTVSRYGLIPTVPSMDQIGIVCKTLAQGRRALSIISGYDQKDGTMDPDWSQEKADRNCRVEAVKQKTDGGRLLRVGVPTNVLAQIPNSSKVMDFAGNFDAIEFELKYFDVYAQVKQILCCAELCNSATRYDGIKFGYRTSGYRGLHELYTKSRTEAFGSDIKLASIVGSMVLTQEYYLRYYDKAMRVRRLIKESLDFGAYDAIVMPESHPSSLALAVHALPGLCGLPAVTAPFRDGGITLIAGPNREDILFTALEAVSI